MMNQPGRPRFSDRPSFRGMNGWRSTLAAGMFAAMLGFTTALGTSSRETASSAPGGSAESRRVGVDLRITNPFLSTNVRSPGFDPIYPNGGDTGGDPDGFDLGDVTAGSTIVRYINAAGGVKPYSYSLAPLLGSSGNPGGPALPLTIPELSNAGKFIAAVPLDSGGAFVLRFDIGVQDAIATQRVGRFKLNLLPRESSFRHAQNQLPLAQRGDTYHTTLNTVSGALPLRFVVLPDSVFFNGKPLPRLQDAGLTLATDGTIFGRPLLDGSLDFTVIAKDATFATALSRNATRENQPYRLTIEKNGSVNTEFAASSVLLRGNTVLAGADSLAYRGVIDLKGDVLENLAGAPLTLRIGGAAFSGKLNDKGKLAVKLSPGSQFSVSISKNGAFTIKLSGADLNQAIGAAAFADAVDQTLILYLEVGRLRSAEVLTLPTVVKSGKYSLAYRLGKTGVSQGGAFQVLSVSGADGRIDEEDGDRWMVRFLGVPRALDGAAATEVIAKGGNVTIRIGQGFSQTVAVTAAKQKLAFKVTSRDKGIIQLTLDSKNFVHQLKTNTLSMGLTDIPTAFVDPQDVNRNAPSVFPLGIDMTGISGDTGRVIVRNGKSWKQR